MLFTMKKWHKRKKRSSKTFSDMIESFEKKQAMQHIEANFPKPSQSGVVKTKALVFNIVKKEKGNRVCLNKIKL